ncbi:50S ribosomal protein L9 [Spiroplasma clarkii]|uniref:Large ribosomal subunit protein bL9 n=1 Tax=Spiroplasma clarkii TaxID=2139 RepID=A0A1Y0KYW2_9MOLU|nr:50S ribosomal protein L9 [Spiroplasma clarkii]ARU90911.1 50S ribosomal protein L9 [Spiroplasma clarkii]ATX70362.1 50S ribosomal protein L9 [Spiroplasma clarkii]
MKVILIKDVKNYGQKDQIVEVSDGYAANYLIPKGFAIKATKDDLSHLNVRLKKEEQEISGQKIKNDLLKKEIEAIELKFHLRVMDKKPFGTISLTQICDRLNKEFGLNIDKRKFVSHENLNKLGLHYLKIKLDFKVVATLKVLVEGKE